MTSRPADSQGDWVLCRREGYGRASLYVPPCLVPKLGAGHYKREKELQAAEEAALVERLRAREEEEEDEDTAHLAH